MKNELTQAVLYKAAAASGFNATKSSFIRPSKAGQPLASLVLSELVLPLLPQPTTDPDPAKELASIISITTGFVFEVAVEPMLRERHPGYTLVEQPELSYNSFTGRADYMLVAPDQSHVVVVDCKAFGVSTKREILERKLTKGWGYPTQLAIYGMGASNLYPEADIELVWCCLCVPNRKVFYISQEPHVTIALAAEVETRVQLFHKVAGLFNEGNFEAAAKVVVEAPACEQLPPKGFFYGHTCASAPIHYSPYSPLFYPAPANPEETDDGYPIAGEDLQKLLVQLMKDAKQGNVGNYQSYINELQKTT